MKNTSRSSSEILSSSGTPSNDEKRPSGQLGTTQKQEKKRRGKSENEEEKIFKCKYCEKSYLSQTAQYAHMKTKHFAYEMNRGRGRPKKQQFHSREINPCSFEYFKDELRKGTTADISKILKSACQELLSEIEADSYPLAKLEEEDTKSEVGWNCDTILSQYVSEVGHVTNPEYFALVAKFAIHCRECANRFSWIKLFQKNSPTIETPDSNNKIHREMILSVEQIRMMSRKYTTVNNAEFLPEIANEFSQLYLPSISNITPEEVVEFERLFLNFCEWLLGKGLYLLKNFFNLQVTVFCGNNNKNSSGLRAIEISITLLVECRPKALFIM